LLRSDDGQDLVEYALVVALVAFGATAGMHILATGLSGMFTKINAALTVV
jgi:pilus assembly protein Flp/PilA